MDHTGGFDRMMSREPLKVKLKVDVLFHKILPSVVNIRFTARSGEFVLTGHSRPNPRHFSRAAP